MQHTIVKKIEKLEKQIDRLRNRPISLSRARKQVEEAIKKRKGHFGVNDIFWLTGLSLKKINLVMRQLEKEGKLKQEPD